ncbi:MAG TPA: RNase adapter RapZ [Thermoanaerobaculia bacterium]|nr:RNase adapter RapZ [Thermoanaerobaculia bacterium]
MSAPANPPSGNDRPPAPPARLARLAVITGLSGSGKSIVAKCFEDLSYYTVDNLPLPLLRLFLDNPLELVEGHDRIAVVTDVRAPGFAEEFPRLFAEIDRERIEPTLLFLEASDEVLVRRFSETRRPHPLAPDRHVVEGIQREREMLAELRARADMVFDTSAWSIHEIRNQVYREFATTPGEEPGMVVSLVSFGFKHGIPQGTDLLFDVRFLPNPHFVPGLRERTGQDAEVLDYLERQPDFQELVIRLTDLLAYLLPRYRRENRSYLSVAIGCTGGRHRSVAIAERLKGVLEERGWPARVIHRDIAR